MKRIFWNIVTHLLRVHIIKNRWVFGARSYDKIIFVCLAADGIIQADVYDDRNEYPKAYIYGFQVGSVTWRGRGVGSMLLRCCEEYIKKNYKGIIGVDLHVNDEDQHVKEWYNKHGYKEAAGEFTIDENEDLLRCFTKDF